MELKEQIEQKIEDMSKAELQNLVLELASRIDAAVDFASYDWDSQSSQLRVITETLLGK